MQSAIRLLIALLLPLGAAAQQSRSLAINGPGTDSAVQPGAAPPAPAEAAATIFHTAEVLPAFPGGPGAQLSFLRDKLKYPEEALRRGLAGKVLVQFVVDERGHLLDPQVVRGLSPELDAEALRLVRIMPWWTPGLIGGRPVKVSYTLPIVFRALE